MIRFVVGPEDRLVPDIAGKLPGRGLWVTAQQDMLMKAVTKNLFTRAARRPVKVDAELVALVDRLLERQCLDLLGLGRGAGAVVAGFEKVEGLLRSGPAGVLVEAVDGAADGRSKLRRLAGATRVVDILPAAALAEALGREGVVVHAAIRRGKLAEKFVAAADRLAGLRGMI